MTLSSEHDAHSDTPWINKLVDYTAYALKQKRIRIVGVCFGHQIIARALGVKVGRNPDGWEAAVNDVQLTKKGQELFRLENLVSPVCAAPFDSIDSGLEDTSDAP